MVAFSLPAKNKRQISGIGDDYWLALCDPQPLLTTIPMKTRTLIPVVAVLFAAFTLAPSSAAQTNGPRITSAVWTNGAFSLVWTNSGTNAVTIERSTSLASGSWTAIGSNNLAGTHSDTNTPVGSAFYRLRMVTGGASTTNMSLIPAGSFEMGNSMGPIEGDFAELPVHTVSVSAFYMDQYEVTKALWDEVANWAATTGYDISAASVDGKAANHPVYFVTWHEAVKWCNARSEKEGLTPCYTVGGAVMKTGTSDPDCNFAVSGYRLPTEAEWEKAARGGLSGQRFPWGDTISHSQANYYSQRFVSYDVSPTRELHPTYATGDYPYSSPVGSFAANWYGLYDMAGNMWEWCWDWYSESYYASSPSSDPRGPSSGSYRVVRGGNWNDYAYDARSAGRNSYFPDFSRDTHGFRCARSSVP